MIPIYTHYLTPADYGIYEMLQLTAAIFTMFITMGLSSATLRYYFEYNKEKERATVISTALIISICLAVTGAVVANLARMQLSLLCFDTTDYAGFFTIVLFAMAFEVVMEVPLTFIRAKELSHIFAGIAISRLLVALSLNIYFIVHLKMGLEGILYSNLITSAIFGMGVIVSTLLSTSLIFSSALMSKLIAYGWPLIFSGFGFFVINASDRFFLKHYTGIDELGLYSLGLKFSSILTVVILGPFWKMYGPYRFAIMNREDAKQVYANVQKGFFLLMTTCALGIVLLTKDMLIIMTPKAFHRAHIAVPYLCLSTMCLTSYYLFQTGIYIEKKTKVVSKLVTLAACVNIAFNLILIPKNGMIGAAVSKLLSFLLLAILTLIVSQRIYKIRYDYRATTFILLTGILAYVFSHLIVFNNVWIRMISNTSLVLIFLITMLRFCFGDFSRMVNLFFVIDAKRVPSENRKKS